MKHNKYTGILKYTLIVLACLVLSRCVYLNEVDQPSEVKAGQDLVAVMHTRFEIAEARAADRIVVGILVPKSWNAAANTTMTYTTTSMGSGTMVKIPAGVLTNGKEWPAALRERYGIGPNLLDDMEWVVFWSQTTYDVVNGDKQDVDIKIVTKTGPENMRVKLGYFIASSSDGLNDFYTNRPYKAIFKDCFEVTDGDGDLVDFCNPQLAITDPNSSLDNDIMTITFNADVVNTPLTGAQDVYFCVKAYTNDGQVIDRCVQQPGSRMPKAAGVGNRYSITFWPRQYFNVSANQTINRLEYYFTDASGNIKVGYGNTASPFVYTFKCK
ncbi:protein of unknown function [Chitinophaga terrae (ex Kim and Jung 2007)]|jgi:hypothetical protein|uniref:DUF4961 domain-containing protein n=1 Tax=Chitinophaga terrae (ex Kim and Jung 2007) TaxID=408074 RepID=A0A1H3ZH86_9BACT|nr:DUF4961 domain-containing protein [Chitinophaga terrae (ex Kim and Jung 2007)]MDQ0109756.1 hypothetical protein [Chitinophaga terrae (ex Kim and Jung 2007)]GEP88746.1 hypothetical protein CTE07_03910 [Chitinophaga terrae (ex Kim and Jung 2007)]SEA22908.1 protein of unknown function [Chitinophaga terrae (ex Kim and Jung 2007)]